MEWLAGRIRNATLCTLDDVGHFPFLEAAEQFTQQVAAFITTTTTLPSNIADRYAALGVRGKSFDTAIDAAAGFRARACETSHPT